MKEMMKEIKIISDIIIKMPEDIEDEDGAILELETVLNDKGLITLKRFNEVGVRFHFKERKKK